MTNESAVRQWYENPRTGTTASPAQGSIEGGANSDINSSVAEHMGAFFLDPSGSQRAARYYHQSMHSPYGGVASHGKSKMLRHLFENIQKFSSFVWKGVEL